MSILSFIKEQCNFSQTPQLLNPLSGGDINTVLLIQAEDHRWVVKQNEVNRFPDMLEKEYRAMEFLHANSPLFYPKVLAHFKNEQHQFLVLEYIESGENHKSAQESFGRGLAEQHRLSDTHFGWTEDNYIGRLVQVNQRSTGWIDFFVENRLLLQSKMAFDQSLFNKTVLNKIENLCNQLEGIIPEEEPALLHGDLWGGNYFINRSGQAVLYDPAIYYGHREMDLAMTKLFGGFAFEFYESYQNELALAPAWKERLPIFQLYPYLVHLNMFGTSYLPAIQDIVRPF